MREKISIKLRIHGVALAAALAIGGFITTAHALTIPVNAGNPVTHIGDIVVNKVGDGVKGDFTSLVGGPPPTLAAAAAAAGEDHFNWYQIVSGTHPLVVGGGPQVDPLPGGQGGQWADRLPWYYDEYSPAAGTAGFDPAYLLSSNTFADHLHFEDYPFGPVGTSLTYKTWLVSVNADGSFHEFHDGFTWTLTRNADTGGGDVSITIGGPTALAAGPTKAEYQDLIAGFQTSIPEPSTLALITLVTFVTTQRQRRRAA